MNIQHLNVKLYLENPDAVNLEEFISIFNRWIRERATGELLVDVADYRHVFNGPGILLIGHEANYGLDHGDGRLGLLYNRKAQVSGSIQDRLAQAVHAALTAGCKLEREQGLKFSGREVTLIFNERLLTPNAPETFAALEPELKTFFDRYYAGTEYALNHETDPRERFTVNVRAGAAFDIERLLNRLTVQSETAHA